MIRALIVGVGNIGQGVLSQLSEFPDIELAGIITRKLERVVEQVKGVQQALGVKIWELGDKGIWGIEADVAILCGGSKDDLPEQGPMFARGFNTVDSFDTHGHIDHYMENGVTHSGYFHNMDLAARDGGHLSAVCQGWDPGLFSQMRALFTACMPGSKVYAFYGLTPKGGLSMGHSNACLRVAGVSGARSYTHARVDAIDLVRSGAMPELNPADKHWRECFVSLHCGASESRVRKEIQTMPEYFADYDTVVKFVSDEELARDHQSQAHDGLVIMASPLGVMEYRNQWTSNPLATAGIMLAAARATVRLRKQGLVGAITPLDIPIDLMLEGNHHLFIV